MEEVGSNCTFYSCLYNWLIAMSGPFLTIEEPPGYLMLGIFVTYVGKIVSEKFGITYKYHSQRKIFLMIAQLLQFVWSLQRGVLHSRLEHYNQHQSSKAHVDP